MNQYKEYEVREVTVKQVMPLMDMMEIDPRRFQLELAKLAIYKDGEPLGDGVEDLSFRRLFEVVGDGHPGG
jgi:hypothetical protein